MELFGARREQSDTFRSLMPGVGSDEPNLNSATMPSVKSSFLRRSGVRNARMNAVSMRDPFSSLKPAFKRLPYPTRWADDRPAYIGCQRALVASLCLVPRAQAPRVRGQSLASRAA